MAASSPPAAAGGPVVYHHGATAASAMPLVPDSLAKALKAVVFDFDLTVLCIHSYSERIEPETIASRDLEKDYADLKTFEAVCKGLTASKVRVAIASFGRKDVITEYLRRAFGDDMDAIFPPEAICTPADVGSIDGHALPDGKNNQIKTLMKNMGLADDPRGILFFDDDRENCTKAAAIGVLPFFCPRHLTEATWTRACTNLPAAQGKLQRKPVASAAAAPAPATDPDGAAGPAAHHLAPSSTDDPSA